MNGAIWLLLLLLLAVLVLLLRLLIAWFRRRHRGEGKHGCSDIPPDVARRPDPCIYSQPYLMAKGLAVTWDNPDIQITTPGGVVVPSHNLTANTDYIVVATIHNASFDAALGVQVRCFYRPWSFGTPDRVPVEVDANGNPAVRTIHIGAWGQTLAKFTWRTPNVQNAHFCLQVECFHPADREPNNNLGQENTQVSAAASDVEFVIPLFNFRRRNATVRIAANEYAIAERDVSLKLQQIRGYRSADKGRLASVASSREELRHAVERDAARGARIRLSLRGRRGSRGVGYRLFGYDGIGELHQTNGVKGSPLRDGWRILVDDAEAQGDEWRLGVAPRTARDVRLRIRVPDNTPAGMRKAVNIWATDGLGNLLGGVTIYVTKEA